MSRPESENSLPHLPPDSPGSSVSSHLQEEYNELLKYAVVLPNYNPLGVRQTLSDGKSSFPQFDDDKIITIAGRSHYPDDSESGKENRPVDDLDEAEEMVTPRNLNVQTDNLPDFSHSPVEPHTPVMTESAVLAKQSYMIPQRFPDHQSVSEHSDHTEFDRERSRDEVMYTVSIDPDVGRMETLLDQWSLELKRNVLAEFSQSKIRIVELSRQEFQKEKERHVADRNQMLNEVDSLKELLHTYEQSVERKDQVISNLTHAMHKQREKFELAKKFSDWKIRHNDTKREAFASNLARRHYEKTLSQKVWCAWHSIIETKWKNRVERACQSKAQEVCMDLTNDYETKLASLNEALESSRDEVAKLMKERERYEEAMKKAFMRGVCALNLEAMTMFHGEEEQPVSNGKGDYASEALFDNLESRSPEKEYGTPKTIPQEAIYTSHPPEYPPARVITSQGSRSMTSVISQTQSMPSSKLVTTTSSSRGKVINAKISARVDSGKVGKSVGTSNSTTLAPPMASVIVERHQPVTKQTIGHATASKYPKSQASQSAPAGHIFKRLAGQGSAVTVAPHIQTVKVVD